MRWSIIEPEGVTIDPNMFPESMFLVSKLQ